MGPAYWIGGVSEVGAWGGAGVRSRAERGIVVGGGGDGERVVLIKLDVLTARSDADRVEDGSPCRDVASTLRRFDRRRVELVAVIDVLDSGATTAFVLSRAPSLGSGTFVKGGSVDVALNLPFAARLCICSDSPAAASFSCSSRFLFPARSGGTYAACIIDEPATGCVSTRTSSSRGTTISCSTHGGGDGISLSSSVTVEDEGTSEVTENSGISSAATSSGEGVRE